MPDTVNVAGKPVNKTLLIGGVGIVLVAGVYYYRKNKATAASQASVDTAGQSAIDPATGYPYGSPEDAAALSAQGNYQNPTTLGGYGYTGYAGGSGSGSFGSGQPGSFNNNAEWAQFVEAYEINNMGADAPTVGNAIGKYITGQPLTTDAMISIVQSAIAIGGYPPVSGPNGNPPGYATTSAPAPIPTPKPTPTPTPTTGKLAGAISNLQAKVSGTTATVNWNNALNATQGYFYELTDLHGVIIKKGNTKATSVSISGLKHGITYNFGIQALPGGAGNNIHIHIP